MRILSRYLGSTILKTIALVTVMLLGLEMFILFMGEIGDIGNGHYHLLQALHYTLLMLPQSIYHLFPMAALLGTLLGLGSLATHHELVVMRAAGVSIGQITRTVIMLALVSVIALGAIGEGFGPNLAREAAQHKAEAMSSGQALQTLQGTWVRNGKEYVRIHRVLPGQHLDGVTIYRFDHDRLMQSISAARAVYVDKAWQLQNVQVSHLDADHVKVTHVARMPWSIHLTPKMLVTDNLSPNQMSLHRLHRTMRYRASSGLRTGQYQFEFWQRILQPLATAVMMLLALPFIFGPLRSTTMGLRIISGVMVGFGFYILNQFFGPISMVYQLPPFIAACLPTLLFAALGLWLLRRAH
ncbi:MAG: LPS export ABC transporter permease LptG [marine bacterium B5-7]|nr:MAG: LPS export ABC transporter permease LptG [marine bacterium B5-7]